MEKAKSIEIATQIVTLLDPLSSTERKQVIQASLLLLGDNPQLPKVNPRTNDGIDETNEQSDLPKTVNVWLKQNQLSSEQLHNVFHISNDGADIILSAIPGNNKKTKIRNCYLLIGLSRFITIGESTFTDEEAREICRNFGVYDDGNHKRDFDPLNYLVGSIEKGWKLTMPGLKAAAELIKSNGANGNA